MNTMKIREQIRPNHVSSCATLLLVLSLICGIPGCESSGGGPVELETVTNSIGMKFLVVPNGTLLMGSNSGDGRERPVHEVTITQPYGLGMHEVTQQQFTEVMGKNRKFTSPNSALDKLRWPEADAFCKRLSNLPSEKSAGRVYRLPTEAEWENACRAGTTTKFSFGDDPTLFGQFGWYSRISGGEPHSGGQKLPNPWGFYDMHGNTWEWCQNWYYDYGDVPITDPRGPETGRTRVLRGGGWFHRELDCRSASRFSEDPNSPTKYLGGMRVAFTSN